jgi:protein SCO1/2
MHSLFLRLAAATLAAAIIPSAQAAGDATRGAQLFGACASCHSLAPDRNMTGPSLAGIAGRTAGSLPSFERYSPELSGAKLTWDDVALDAWLTSPAELVPGNRMGFPGVADARQRADLIAFLHADNAVQERLLAQAGGAGGMGGMMGAGQPMADLPRQLPRDHGGWQDERVLGGEPALQDRFGRQGAAGRQARHHAGGHDGRSRVGDLRGARGSVAVDHPCLLIESPIMDMRKLKFGWLVKLLLGGLVALLVLDLAAYIYLDRSTAAPGEGPAASSARIGGPFSLIDQDGKQVSDRDYRGKWLLVYFGFTHCPDACPTALGNIAEAMSRLGTVAGRVQPLLITIDPERDTPSVLKDYVGNFGEAFAGLTGTPEKTAEIAHSYRVYYAKHPAGEGDYTMDHSSVIYVMDPAGQFVANFGTDSAPDAMVAKLRALMSEAGR